MLPEPYYRDERSDITIYCGDALEILPELPRVGLVCTDPPYGIGKWNATGGQSLSAQEAVEISKWDVRPDDALILACVAAGDQAVVWGGNYFAGLLGACRAPLIWDKGIRGMHFADGEMAWTSFDFGTLRILELNAGASDARGARQHPTQKPTALMHWCIELSKTEGAVLDPFMGSGTTLRAAKDLGRPAIGIDREEKYCAVAVQRLGQEVFSFTP